MKTCLFSEAQVVNILNQKRHGVKVADICKKYGIAVATFYKWRSKYGHLSLPELKELRQLRLENARVNRLLTGLELENELLKDLLSKKALSTEARRNAVHYLQINYATSMRHSCNIVGISRSVLKYQPRK